MRGMIVKISAVLKKKTAKGNEVVLKGNGIEGLQKIDDYLAKEVN